MVDLYYLMDLLATYYVVSLIISVVLAVVCGILARRKGRGVVRWVFASLLLGVIALIILALLQDISYDSTSERVRNTEYMANLRGSEAIKTWECPACGAENVWEANFCAGCSKYNSQKKAKEDVKKVSKYSDNPAAKEWTCDCGTVNEGSHSRCKSCKTMRY